MSYEYITRYDSPNYSKGRPEGAPAFIVIHHWGADGQTFTGVVNYLCRRGGNSSAHYVVEAGRVACIVDPDDRAWHAGKLGNPRGIGIECRPEATPADVDTVAELVADLRQTYGNIPLKLHSEFMATQCPGRWASLISTINAKAATRTGTPSSSTAGLNVDGWAGKATVSALQRLLGTPVDGIISGQTNYNLKHCPRFNTMRIGVGGSLMIRALQSRFGVSVDGLIGEQTVKAWQNRLGVSVDGYAGVQTVTAIQTALNKGELY